MRMNGDTYSFPKTYHFLNTSARISAGNELGEMKMFRFCFQQSGKLLLVRFRYKCLCIILIAAKLAKDNRDTDNKICRVAACLARIFTH